MNNADDVVEDFDEDLNGEENMNATFNPWIKSEISLLYEIAER